MKGIVGRQALAVEDDAADGGLEARGAVGDVEVLELAPALDAEDLATVLLDVGVLGRDAHRDPCLDVEVVAAVVGVERVLEAREHATLAGNAVLLGGEEVHAEDHVLGRHGEDLARRRRAQVVAREHEDAGLGLGLGGQRHVHGHLVAVEVCVEGRADQRVQVDGLALDEHRLEGLDGQAVQRRCAVEQDQAVLDDLVEHVPDHGHAAVDGALGTLDVLDLAELDETAHDEGLEELERHGRRAGRTGAA